MELNLQAQQGRILKLAPEDRPQALKAHPIFQHVTSSVPVIIWAKGTYANYILLYICIYYT